MLRAILLSAVGSLLFGLTMALAMRARNRESDPSGNPTLRHLAVPYVMLVCAACFLAVAVVQWFDPVNHRYSGNLLLLSYIPAMLGLLAIAFSIHLATYRATLRKTAIEVRSWPFGEKRFNLADLERIEGPDENNKTTLRFSGKKKFVVYGSHSGHAHFLSELRARHSA
jgi:hypothetical protein